MARIVCQVRYRPERVTLTWSDGQNWFRPYALTGAALQSFERCSQQASERYGPDGGLALAQLGYELFQSLFADQPAMRDWVMAQSADVLEIVSDSPGATPWNIVYGQPPDEGSFRARHPDAYRPFWGVRFALAAGSRTSTWRTLPIPDAPQVVAIIDSHLRNALPESEQRQLQELIDDKSIKVVTEADLIEGFAEPADVVFVLAPATEQGFSFAGQQVTAHDLREALLKLPSNPEPLLLLNLTGSGKLCPQTFRSFHGLIVPATPLEPAAACGLGVEMLRELLTSGDGVARILQRLRSQTIYPGIVYEVRCPADVRVLQDGADEVPQPPARPLPEQPYRPLAAYDREHQALFAGRDQDLGCFASLLNRAESRIVVLHGGSSVGKTSFLQAGLLPFIEDSALGFHTLQDRGEDGANATLVLRASGDLLGQLASALCAFCARPMSYQTPTGESVTVDLPGVIARFLRPRGASEQVQAAAPPPVPVEGSTSNDAGTERLPRDQHDDSELWAVLHHRHDLLGEVLAGIAAELPGELLIIIDQAEELFTQAGSAIQERERRATLRALEQAARAGSCKVIVSLRSDYAGRLFHELPLSAQVREYLLHPLSEQQIMEAIVLPTASDPILFSTEVPYAKFGFQYADGVQKRIAVGALQAAADQQIGVLPLVQCLCARLAEFADEKPDRIIRDADIKRVGGIDDAVVNYLERKLNNLPVPRHTRRALESIMPMLYTQHPDGTLTLDLVPAPELKKEWNNSFPIQDAVHMAAKEDGVFEVERLLVDGSRGLYVTLKQDALAQANMQGERRKARKSSGTSLADFLWIGIPLTLLVLALVFFWRQSTLARSDLQEKFTTADEQLKKIVPVFKEMQKRLGDQELPLYSGTLAAAERAWEFGNVLKADTLLRTLEPKERAFEWFYLWRLVHPDSFVLSGPKTLISRIAVAPQGQFVAFCEDDGATKVWDAKSRSIIASLKPQGSRVAAVAFADEGKTLLTAGVEGRLNLWDIGKLQGKGATPEPVKSLDNGAPIFALAAAPDKGIAIAGAGKKIIIWDLAKGEKVKELTDHGSEVLVLTASLDGSTFASADSGGAVHIWKSNGEKLQSIKSVGHTLRALALTPDGKVLATGGFGEQVETTVGVARLWKTESGSAVTPPIQHGLGVNAVAFTPDGKTLLTAGKDPVIRLWNAEDGSTAGMLRGQYGWVRSVGFSADGSTIAAADDTGMRVWQTASAPHLFPFARSPHYEERSAHKGAVSGVAMAKDGKVVASGGLDGAVKLWNHDGALLATLAEAKNAVTSLALSAAADQLFAGTATTEGGGEVHRWRLKNKDGSVTSEYVGKLEGIDKAVYCLTMSADDQQLAVGGAGKSISIFDGNGKKIRDLEGNRAAVRSLDFDPTGKILASGGDDAMLRIWEVESGKAIPFPQEHGAPISAVLFYVLSVPQPRPVIVTAGLDGGVHEWSLLDRKKVYTYRGHANGASALAVSPDERVLFSASWDQTIKAFDTARGPERYTFAKHQAPVMTLAIGGDPPMMVSGDRDGVVRFWRTTAVRDVPVDSKKDDQPMPEPEPE